MIGPRYWATGILLKWDSVKWYISLEFFDDGWCDLRSTQGKLSCRYLATTKEMPAALDILIADAGRLGIEFKITAGMKPTLYVPGDGEWKDEVYHPEWRSILSEQAERIGWRNVYAGVPV